MESVKWAWNYIKMYKVKLILIFLLVTFSSLLSLVNPLITGQIVNEVIGEGKEELLFKLIFTMIGVTVIRTVVRYTFQILCETIGQNAVFKLKEDLYDKLQELDLDFFKANKVGDIMARMTGDTDSVRHFVAWVSYNIVENLILFVMAIIMLFSIDVKLTLSLLIIAPIIGIITAKMSKEVRPTFVEIRESFSRLNSVVKENISGNKVVKAFASEEFEIKKFNEYNRDLKKRNLDSSKIWAKYLPLLDSLAVSMSIIVILFGGLFVINGKMTVGDLVVFNGYLWMINNPMRMAVWLINDVQKMAASTKKIREMLESEPKIQNSDENVSKKVKGNIEFKDVYFNFEDDKDTKVLKNINFSVNPGQTIAILGETGSGKSTLINLIGRFYDVSEGKILIDGIDIKEWNLKDLRDCISTVMQDVFLFSDSIEGNISFGKPTADFGKVQFASEKADAHSFISKLEYGYETIVGERGTGLSGGQKQRISLARALLKDPSILILDDTTSAVDMETEHKIQQELKTLCKDKTTIIIANRISSVKEADLILVLENGEIIERGKHEELLKNESYYYNVYKTQLGDFDIKEVM